jgi:hypothetical protein
MIYQVVREFCYFQVLLVTSKPDLVDAKIAIAELFGVYYQLACDRVRDVPLNDQQLLGLSGNASALASTIAPALDATLGGGGGDYVTVLAQRHLNTFLGILCNVKVSDGFIFNFYCLF